MIKLIIADDEPIIRNGMKDIIDWNALGYSLIGLAKDGMQALEFLEQEDIDVIITDIRMPFLDGLGLVKVIKRLYPEIYCILLSSYAEFEYAQQAIELDVFSYMIKPVDVNELEIILSDIKEDYNKRDQKQKYISKLELYIQQLEDFKDTNSLSSQSSEDELLDLGESYILKNYTKQDFSLTNVARYVGFEPSYFSRLFKKKYKIGFQDYIISLRIEKSKLLLGTGFHTATVVCELVGYENYSHFSSLFKKKVGVSPSSYIKLLNK